MAKVKAGLVKVAHLLLSKEALAIEKPLLKKLLTRYGISVASAAVLAAELLAKFGIAA